MNSAEEKETKEDNMREQTLNKRTEMESYFTGIKHMKKITAGKVVTKHP